MSTNENLNLSVNGQVNVGLEEFEGKTTGVTDALFQIFSQSNIVIILWFLAVYFVVYILLGIFRGTDAIKPSISRWIDIVSLLCLLAYLGTTFFTKSDADKSQMIRGLYEVVEQYANNPVSLISVGFFILTLYIVIYILELPMDANGKPITISIIENGAWILFVIILIATFLRYIAGVSLTGLADSIGDYLQKKSETTTSTTVSTNTKASTGNTISSSSVAFDEVFNVGNNMYTYDDAQSVCKSLGTRLATYDDIESAYNKGGEWCNYGWSEGQTAYFPTQKNTWNNLQKSESTKHSCGRPGINGGYIANPNVRFGVNCYGKKPQPKPSDLESIGQPSIPKSAEDVLLDKKVEFWKKNGHKLFQINRYNNAKWSMY